MKKLLCNLYRLFSVLVCLFVTPAQAYQPLPVDKSAAVILVYYRVGEDEYPPTNIRTEQFLEHIEELQNGTYNILPLPEIVAALKSGAELPDRTVAITFDGGYKSILTNAAPILFKKNIPFTIFVSTENLSHPSASYIDGGELKKLAKNKLVTVGLHTSTYARLADKDEEEIKRQINGARASLRKIIGQEAALFAYPFGEYTTAYKKIILDSGFTAAFSQQSGVAYTGLDMATLPRFTMTESYGGLDRFRLTANAMPLPVKDISPVNPQIETRRPEIGFTVDESLQKSLSSLSCFASGQTKPRVEIIGGTRIELRLDEDLDSDRTRINCTLPVQTGYLDDDIRWRWYGMVLSLPSAADDDYSSTPANINTQAGDRMEE